MKLWSDEDFLMYGGVDGLVMIYFLRFATDQCLFASVVGLLVLVPAYHTGRGLYAGGGDDDGEHAREWSFSETTVQNIRCRFDVAEELGENPLFPECRNGRSQFRFALVVACAWLFTLRALAKLAENYQQFVHLRHWYLTSGLSRRAPGIEAQRALTVKVENLPEGLRTMDRVKKKFEKLCGPGSVHSAHVMVDGLKDLDGLCAQRNKAQDALEDAISKRAKLAAVLAADADARLRKALDARAAAGDDRARAGTWFGFRSDSDPESPRKRRGSSVHVPWFEKFACKNDEPRDDAPEADLIGLDEQVTEDHGALYATAGGEIAKTQRRARTNTISRRPTWRLALPAVRRREAVDAIPRHVNCPGCGPACGCLYGYSEACDGYFVHSIPYYEQLVAELNQAILREHFAKMAAAELHGQRARRERSLGSKRNWRGCFWRVDDEVSSDDDEERPTESPEQAGGKASSPERGRTWASQRRSEVRSRKRHERQRHRIMGGQAAERHWMAVLGAEPLRESLPHIWRRVVRWADHNRNVTLPTYYGVAKAGLFAIFRDYLCGGEKETLLATAGIVGGRDASFAPSGTAFPFAMEAGEAPEPRDVIWENVYVSAESVSRRQWVVNGAILTLVVFWASVVSFCASSTQILSYLGFDPASTISQAIASILPVIVLLSIINLLPLFFQLIARFYERLKAHSEVDLSVVERFFRFQFINVYVSILSTAILSDLKGAWESPFTFVRRIGLDTPEAAFYFAKLIVFQCGSSPLWLLRAWPLISRGFKTWTVQPPELPGMMYGWAFPKVMMTFTIFSTFWVFAPLLSVISLVYFSLISFAFRYLILFVHMPVYESGGRFYYRMVERVLFGVLVSNAILFFWLLARSLVGYALLVSPLPLLVLYFREFAEEAYGAPSVGVALDEAVTKDRHVAASVDARFESNLYTQPALRDQGHLDADAELESLLHDGDPLLAAVPAEPESPAPAEGRKVTFDVADSDRRRRPLVPLSTPETADDVARKSAMMSSLHRLSRLPDARRPHEASRERRRVSMRLDAAYRGDVDSSRPWTRRRRTTTTACSCRRGARRRASRDPWPPPPPDYPPPAASDPLPLSPSLRNIHVEVTPDDDSEEKDGTAPLQRTRTV
ncbi:hypothetical protein JL722_5141 [Aureococcus anophagefferens]|nr:hypothetical protein JL722_5141 [Aureococcus anophagefferens]